MAGVDVYTPTTDTSLQDATFPNPENAALPVGAHHIKDVTYRYDVFGQRIAKVFADIGTGGHEETEYYVPDSGRTLLEFDHQQRLVRQNFYAAAVDMVLAAEEIDYPGGTAALGEIAWALPDHEGTVKDIYHRPAGGAWQNEHLQYDSFGQPLHRGAELDVLKVRFAGQDFDWETGLYYDQVRHYDAVSGRYLSEDPRGVAGGDTNLYRYHGNSPVNQVLHSLETGASWSLTEDEAWQSDYWHYFCSDLTRIGGVLRFAGGMAEGLAGLTLLCGGTVSEGLSLGTSTPVSVPVAALGSFLLWHGADNAGCGLQDMLYGTYHRTTLSRTVEALTGSEALGEWVDMGAGCLGTIGASRLMTARASQTLRIPAALAPARPAASLADESAPVVGDLNSASRPVSAAEGTAARRAYLKARFGRPDNIHEVINTAYQRRAEQAIRQWARDVYPTLSRRQQGMVKAIAGAYDARTGSFVIRTNSRAVPPEVAQGLGDAVSHCGEFHAANDLMLRFGTRIDDIRFVQTMAIDRVGGGLIPKEFCDTCISNYFRNLSRSPVYHHSPRPILMGSQYVPNGIP